MKMVHNFTLTAENNQVRPGGVRCCRRLLTLDQPACMVAITEKSEDLTNKNILLT